jgi:hypothetical protein
MTPYYQWRISENSNSSESASIVATKSKNMKEKYIFINIVVNAVQVNHQMNAYQKTND